MRVWTTKRGTTRKWWPDKPIGDAQAGNFFVKDSLLATCKAGLFTGAPQDGYHASTRTSLGVNASALIAGAVRG